MAAENLPEEVSLDQLKGDCQERWDQAGGEQQANAPQPNTQDVQPSVERPTPELPARQGQGGR